jgi:hypothetical protein
MAQQLPGVLVGRWAPPPSRSPFASAIKCHQKSTCNSAGSSVGSWVLSTHTHTRVTGHPTAGWCGCACRASTQYPSCSFVLAPRAPNLRLGAKAPLPLRTSSRGVLTGAGALAAYRTPILAGLSIETAVASRPPIGIRLLRGVVLL